MVGMRLILIPASLEVMMKPPLSILRQPYFREIQHIDQNVHNVIEQY
jgi:hypothetical protein